MLTTHLRPSPADPVLSLAGSARADPRTGKIDLTVGVYRDANGATPVMRAVHEAEAILLRTERSKSYLSVVGDPVFLDHLRELVLPAAHDRPVAALQSPGGTGALRLAAELLASGMRGRRIWVAQPTWSNHKPVFVAAGLDVRTFHAFDAEAQRALPDAYLAAIAAAEPGDAILLQPVCQNPTGADLADGDLTAIGRAIATRGLVPLLDMAYHGFGKGLGDDAARIALLLAECPEALLAYSCSKNFSMYRERIGAIFAIARSEQDRGLLFDNIQALARSSYSMPPAHGASIIRTIMTMPDLRADWEAELRAMTARVAGVRADLAGRGIVGGVDLSALGRLAGMFCLLPLSPARIAGLQRDHAIYMPDSGRINIAGLAGDQIDRLASALRESEDRDAAPPALARPALTIA